MVSGRRQRPRVRPLQIVPSDERFFVGPRPRLDRCQLGGAGLDRSRSRAGLRCDHPPLPVRCLAARHRAELLRRATPGPRLERRTTLRAPDSIWPLPGPPRPPRGCCRGLARTARPAAVIMVAAGFDPLSIASGAWPGTTPPTRPRPGAPLMPARIPIDAGLFSSQDRWKLTVAHGPTLHHSEVGPPPNRGTVWR
jgi:hypothetical protein